MAVTKSHPRPGRILEQRQEHLLRQGIKLTQDSRHLIANAKRLVGSSQRLVTASRQRGNPAPR